MTESRSPDHIFERVQVCLDAVVGGSGHLTSYRLDRESFVVSDSRSLDDEHVEYEFVVSGVRLSEFDDVATGEGGEGFVGDTAVTEHLEGVIVLDVDGDVATDETGRVRIRPWRTLHRGDLSADDDTIESLLDELDGED